MLLTGDIEEIAEKQILQEYANTNILKADILKVAHHGSKTSTTQEFISKIEPRVALIGVGSNNKFGHPNMNVIERLKVFGTKVYRTDEDGEISIRVQQKKRIVIKTINIKKF